MFRKILSLVFSFLTIEKGFRLAAHGENVRAWKYVNRKRFLMLMNYPEQLISLEWQLLRMFLQMKINMKVTNSNIFRNIWLSNISCEEKNYLTRYALAVLWLSRSRENECILKIRHNLEINESRVRPDLRRKFRSPDVSE